MTRRGTRVHPRLGFTRPSTKVHDVFTGSDRKKRGKIGGEWRDLPHGVRRRTLVTDRWTDMTNKSAQRRGGRGGAAYLEGILETVGDVAGGGADHDGASLDGLCDGKGGSRQSRGRRGDGDQQTPIGGSSSQPSGDGVRKKGRGGSPSRRRRSARRGPWRRKRARRGRQRGGRTWWRPF